MGPVLRHILTATALLGFTTGQGNGLLTGIQNPSSISKVFVTVGASVNVKVPSVLPKPISSANVGLAVGGNVNVNLGTDPLLAGLGSAVNGVGGVVNNVAFGISNAVAADDTPVGSGLNSVASGAVQAIGAVGDTADSAVANIPPVVSGVGSAVSGLANALGTTAVGITGLAGGLLDVTLDTVSDVFTSATLALLTSAPVQIAEDLVGSLLHPHPRDPKLRGWTYFGCFHPSLYLTTKATLKSTGTSATMSAKICIDLCGPDAKDFSIVRGNECYCSNDAPGVDSGPDKNTGTNQCNLLCVGSLTEYCGGTGQVSDAAITVYKRVVSLLTLPAPAYPTTWTFKNCFYIDAWVALLTTGTAGNSFTAPAGNTDGIACSDLCFATKSTYTTAVVSDQTCYCSTLSITATASLTANLAGLGECSKPCTNKPGESCGGTSKADLALGIAYTRRPAAPSTTPPNYGSISPSGFFNWGCYFGAVYLLDTILTGLQISSLLDLAPDMDGSKCVNLCKAQSHNYAMVIGGVCFCNKKPPTQDLRIVNQVL